MRCALQLCVVGVLILLCMRDPQLVSQLLLLIHDKQLRAEGERKVPSGRTLTGDATGAARRGPGSTRLQGCGARGRGRVAGQGGGAGLCGSNLRPLKCPAKGRGSSGSSGFSLNSKKGHDAHRCLGLSGLCA